MGDTEERARTGCVTYPQLRNTGGNRDSEAVMKHRKGPDEIERRRWKKFTSCEVVKHGILEDAWTIIYGRVYDITTFALTHPGFENAGQVSTALAITRNLGKDCTEEFEYTHSLTAWKQLADFQIGVLASCPKGKACPHCRELPEDLLSLSLSHGKESNLNQVPEKHPLPKWLPDEVVD